MRSIAPRLGDNFPEVTLATDQEEFYEMVACPIMFADGYGAMVSRWKFTEEEKQAIANGEDLFVVLVTGPVIETNDGLHVRGTQPIALSIGRPECTK